MNHQVLVTGGAGFIGSNLVRHLLEEQYIVSVVVRDVCDTAHMRALMRGVDTIFHLAAIPGVQASIDDPVGTQRTNVDGTLSVLEAARGAGVRRVVFTSSSAVYGDTDMYPTAETAHKGPKSPYALQKYTGEQMMTLWSSLYSLETVSLRLFNVYGPHMNPEGPYAAVIGKFLQQRKENKPLTVTGTGEQTRDFVYVGDVARAFVAAATSGQVGKGEAFNIGSGERVSVNDIAKLVGGEVEHLPPRTEPVHSQADTRLAQRMLDWSPEANVREKLTELKHALDI